MSGINCFKKAGLKSLDREFEALVAKGMPERQAAIEVGNRYIRKQHKALADSLNQVRKNAGQPEEAQKESREAAINAKYDKLIAEARAINEDITSQVKEAEGKEAKGKNTKRALAASDTFMKSAETLRRLEAVQAVEPAKAPTPADDIMRMTEGKDALMVSSPILIQDKINEEFVLRDKSVSNGVSMYSNTPQLVTIKNSIENRIAQVRALASLYPKLTAVRETHSLPKLPEITPLELMDAERKLNAMLGITNSLIAESESNSASADLRVAQAVSALLGHTMDYMNKLSEMAIGTEFDGIQKIVAQYRPDIHKALESNATVEAMRIMNIAETTIYNKFSEKKEAVLAVLSKEEPSDLSIHTYDYARGILTLSSSDFWNTYHSVLANSDASVFSPSDEHSVIVKQAVQGLMADAYMAPAIAHPNMVRHHNSAFIEGRGGTAKTKTIVPLIAGIVQHLTGGKVFLTAAKDTNDYKRTTLLTAVETFYKVSDKQLAINLANSSQDILGLLDTPGATADINLIVYDEGTLLSTRDLAEVQSRVDRLNRQRKASGSALLKVLYTGDTLQNSIGMDKSNPDARAIGIDDANRHVIQRTPALTFSFRQSNQQLVLFSSYLETIQKERGISRPFSTEYKSREGVQIHQSHPEFLSNALSYINSLTKQNRLHEAVYITDKGAFGVDQKIADSKILVMSSEEAQGREWPVVFFDPKNTLLFVPEHINLGVKKDYYTASTRASTYMMTHITPGQGITSTEGTVNKVRPLLPEKATRKATIDRINEIIGDFAAPVSQVAFDYSRKTLFGEGDDFPMGDVEPAALKDQSYDSEPSLFDSMADRFDMSDAELEADSRKPEDQPPPKPSSGGLNAGSNIIDYLTAANRSGLVSLHTFFTDSLIPFEEQMALKRKAIYDINARKVMPYFLSINRIGSPGYENVLRNNLDFNGAYAIFVEAEPDGKHVILGTLSTPGLDEAIKQGNLLQGREAVRFPLSPEFLSEIENTGTTVVNKLRQVHSLGDVKNSSKGVRFGTPYIVTIPRAEMNKKTPAEPKAKAGELFIPASFYYTEKDITAVLKANNSSAYITKVPFRTGYATFGEVVTLLDPFVEEGKFNFGANDGVAGRLYDAFWSHNGESRSLATGDTKESRISAAFKTIQEKVRPSDPFYAFLEQYIEREAEPGADEIIEAIKETKDVDVKVVQNSNPKYFLKHYLEAKDKGTRKLVHFERAITELSSNPLFKKGFEFNPRILYGSTEKHVMSHAQARSLPQEIYDKYLVAELDYVSPPIIRMPLKHLLNAIKEAVPVPKYDGKSKESVESGTEALTEQTTSDFDKQIATTPKGQAVVQYSEPTQGVSDTAATIDQNPTSDKAQSEQAQEDDRENGDDRDTMPLEAFQQRWFSRAGYSSMFPETISKFRRGFMDYLFAVNAEDGAEPYLRDINSVVKIHKSKAKELLATFNDEYMDSLAPVTDDHERELYIRGVHVREFSFLLSKYFPTVVQDADTKQYVYRSSHYKNRGFSDKESFNLLTEGMTDMVKTQLYNTPIIIKGSKGFVSTGDYVWAGDIEALVDSVKGSSSTEEVAAHMRDSANQAVQSVYYRFFHNEPYNLDGTAIWSIGQISSPDVMQMRDSVAQFMLSGEIFDLVRVDLDEKRLRMPWTTWGAPNTVRHISHESVTNVANNQGKFIVANDNGSMIIGSLTVNPSSVAPPTDADVLAAVHALGLSTFSAKNLRDMQQLDFPKLNIAPSTDAPQKVNNAIINDIVIPAMKRMSTGKFSASGFRRLNILYDAMVRTSGVTNILHQQDVANNKRYRLQWGAPIYRVNTQIEEIKDDKTSVLVDNLIVRGAYKIEKIAIKNGFQSWKKSKEAKKLSAKEVADFDVIWGYAQMLKDTHADSGQYNTAVLTPMVWSDSPTDPQMIVRSAKGFFRAPATIMGELFASRKSLYQRHSAQILNTWNAYFETIDYPKAISLADLQDTLATHPIPVSQVEKFPGMIANLYYSNSGGNAALKPSLVADVDYYSGNNLADFIRKQAANYAALLNFSNNSKNQDGFSMTERLGMVIEGKSGERVLESFYYNWLAFSTELTNMTAGVTQQYKGDTPSKEFIDNVKRNKLLMANRSAQLFRNYSWRHLWNQEKLAGEGFSEEIIYEGKKLPRHGKVAFVKDIKSLLTIPSGLTKNQELYDGATFVLPTTRIMQKHSNSGNHGIYVGSVMKNVTTVFNNTKGVPTYIKNAEFLITPELMRQGTPRIINLVKRAYSHPFSTPSDVTTVTEGTVTDKNDTGTFPGEDMEVSSAVMGTPWDYLMSKGLSEDLSNAEWSHFEDLMDHLVEIGEQDSLILEIAPDSSVKTGRGATNEIDALEPFVTETIDLVNKGTQLDASHGIDEIASISASQLINALGASWSDGPALLRMYRGLAEIAYTKIRELKTKTSAQKVDYLKAILTNAFSRRPDMSYASRVTAPNNTNNFSIDDRQLVTSAFRNLNAELTDEGVLLDFDGGQYIIHPTNGLIHVYDVEREEVKMTVLKSELQGDEKTSSVGRDLQWNRADGYAEILLPASMRRKFGITPGTKINEVTPEYFLRSMEVKSTLRAEQMFESFQKTLSHLVTRIPATGPHSAVASKIVGFMEESENAIFVPAELLFVQGADQDVDKGTNFSYEVVNGITPKVDEAFELLNKEAFPDKRTHKRARVAGIKNAIVESMEKILLAPNTLQERNTPVDNAKEELEKVAVVAESSYRFERDSYLSHLEMREINQAGMALRGIFSNAMKSYNVMIIAYNAKGIDPTSMGLATDPKVSERLGALVNAAVDNAKDQLMGKLGIGEHNANMVAYMVMKGMDFKTIYEMLQKYAPQMEQMKAYRRYDSTIPFRASMHWTSAQEVPLASLYYLGNEVSRFTAMYINRALPSSDVEMLAFRKGAESFINGQYKAFKMATDFKLIAFLENDEYAEQQSAKYASLKGRLTNGIQRSEFNVLQLLRDAPHISAYMQVFLLSHNMAMESKLYKVSSRLADEVLRPTAQLDDRNERVLADMKEFTYGLFIDQYLQNAENPTKYDLSSPTGRSQFVNAVASTDNLNSLKAKYPDNGFVQALSITTDKKRGWPDAKIMRLPDLDQTSEEKRMQMQADFAVLSPKHRKTMFLYNLVTRHTRFGKESFGTLLSPADKADFNRFLDKQLDIGAYDYSYLDTTFKDFRAGGSDVADGPNTSNFVPSSLAHNSIPYTSLKEKKTPVQMSIPSMDDTVPQGTADFLNRVTDSKFYTTKTPISVILDAIDSVLAHGQVNAMETAYLNGLKQEIENKATPNAKEVDSRAEGCAPKTS